MQGDAKEDIRARLNIEDVVGEYVQLKRAGRNFKGLSPFTSEKTPSFVVSPDKQIWHDFSSGRGGDVFSFVMEAEGLDFRGALEQLARKAGVDLSLYESKGNQSLAIKKKRFAEANRLAARYYQTCLLQNKSALDYVIKKRGLKREIVGDFQIGYAPDNGQALLDALEAKGFSKAELAAAGLLNRFSSDLFRGRMMVPLSDTSGQVIGFTGRIIGEVPNAPKYLNTPQTLLYDKSRHVFGLFQAKAAIREADYAVIVEGNLDVVSSHQAGVKNVVATAGTAMTEQHLKILKRLTSDIRLAYDADNAGLAASERAVGLASGLGIELSVVSLPEGVKDPDELVKKDIKLWQQAIAQPKPAAEWVIERYAEREDLTSASGKRRFTSSSLALVERLADSVEREHYEQIVAGMVGSSLESIKNKAAQLSKQPEKPKKPLKTPTEIDQELQARAFEDHLLAICVIDLPSRELLAKLDLSLLTTPERQQLAKYLQTHPEKALREVPKSLQNRDIYDKIAEVELIAEERYADLSAQDRYFEAAKFIQKIEREHLKDMRDHLVAELRQAEADDDELRAQKIRVELNALIKEIARGGR